MSLLTWNANGFILYRSQQIDFMTPPKLLTTEWLCFDGCVAANVIRPD
jgi:hypothetical protein